MTLNVRSSPYRPQKKPSLCDLCGFVFLCAAGIAVVVLTFSYYHLREDNVDVMELRFKAALMDMALKQGHAVEFDGVKIEATNSSSNDSSTSTVSISAIRIEWC